MGLLSLLFGFKGRINRAQYWLGATGAAIGLILLMVLLTVMAGPINPALPKEQQLFHALTVFGAIFAPTMLVSSWIGWALAWKRFHDRGKSGLWMFLPMPFSFMMFIGFFSAMMADAPLAGAVAAMQPWATILLIIQIWFFVELGCLPSKPGPNKYGDPPGGGATTPVPGAPRPAKANAPIPGMATTLASAESAMDRAIAAQAHAPRQEPPAPRPAMAVANAAAPSGGFGRKANR